VLTWNPFTETATTAQEIAVMPQRREALEIRSLLEYPALRRVMGLDVPAASEATVVAMAPARSLAVAVTEIVATGAPARKRQPKRAPKAANAPRTSKGAVTRATARTASNQHPRFDRRALLESDRVA